MDFRFYDPSVPVTVHKGHLPHWEQAGATYFITARTADSIPKDVWERWRWQRSRWLREHDIDPDSPDWKGQVEALPEGPRLTSAASPKPWRRSSIFATELARYGIRIAWKILAG